MIYTTQSNHRTLYFIGPYFRIITSSKLDIISRLVLISRLVIISRLAVISKLAIISILVLIIYFIQFNNTIIKYIILVYL